jgi:hypothetical protein
MPHTARLLGSAFAVLGTLTSAARLEAADPPVNFARDVQPILSEYCFNCHGPDQAARKGDLRLDTHKDALAAIKPGKSADSELVKRIVSEDPDEMMPPKNSKKKLRAKQIDTLKRSRNPNAPRPRLAARRSRAGGPATPSTRSFSPASNART